MLAAYPIDWVEPMRILVSKIRGQEVPLETAIHAAYQMVGACLAQFIPDGAETPHMHLVKSVPATAREATNKILTVEEMEAILEAVDHPHFPRGILPSREEILNTALAWLRDWIIQQILAGI